MSVAWPKGSGRLREDSELWSVGNCGLWPRELRLAEGVKTSWAGSGRGVAVSASILLPLVAECTGFRS